MAVLGTSGRSYWEDARAHRYSLLFALPLLLAYEALEAIAPVRAHGGVVRNGADVLLTSLFTAALGVRGPMVFMALVIGVALVLVWRDRRPLRARVFAVMFLEACLLAAVFGIVIGTATVRLVGPLHTLAIGAAGLDGSMLARLTLSLGAGLYEELLFRVVLVALIVNSLNVLGFARWLAGTIAVIVGALSFSAFHYIGPLGEPLRLESFLFRFLAGVGFSAMYLLRGFGITAWTHALYDILVLV